MSEIRLSTAIKAAVLAGLVAGLALGVFNLVFTEPVIDRAIALEEQPATGEMEVVSRSLQKIGGLVGFVLLGAAFGALFAGPYALFHRWLPGSSRKSKALLLAGLAYWAITLFPFLKYPANPPGVGDPDTIGYRQAIALGFVALSAIGVGMAVAIYHFLGKRGHRKARGKLPPFGQLRAPLTLGAYLLYAIALYLLMPPNPDEIKMPSELVGQFRWLSLAGLTLLWLALAGSFSLLWGHFTRLKPLMQSQAAQAG